MDLEIIISALPDLDWIWSYCFKHLRNFRFRFGTADYCVEKFGSVEFL